MPLEQLWIGEYSLSSMVKVSWDPVILASPGAWAVLLTPDTLCSYVDAPKASCSL